MKRNWGKIRRFIPMYLMLLPGLVYLFINNYMPMAGIIIAFKKYNYSLGILKSPFTGLKNFEFLFKTKDAWTITRNTLGYNVIFIVVGTVLAIAVAILLNEIRSTMGFERSEDIPDVNSGTVPDFYRRCQLPGIWIPQHRCRIH